MLHRIVRLRGARVLIKTIAVVSGTSAMIWPRSVVKGWTAERLHALGG